MFSHRQDTVAKITVKTTHLRCLPQPTATKPNRSHRKLFNTRTSIKARIANARQRVLWSSKVIDKKINYIHQNPVEAGLIYRAEDYLYSSAIDYAGEKGILDGVIVVK